MRAAIIAVATMLACAPGAGGWTADSRPPAAPLPAAVAVRVHGDGAKVHRDLARILADGLRTRDYLPDAPTPAWTLDVDIRTFDTETMRTQRRVYVELVATGLSDSGSALFRLSMARPTRPNAGPAGAKRHPHVVEIADAIIGALPRAAR